MTSLFGRLKSSNTPNASPTAQSVSKKNEPQNVPTPIEQLLADAGPLRIDGSDKFFGMYNPSNTCYCNSVVQCLYFSTPFREQVVTFPRRGPRDTNARIDKNLRLNAQNGTAHISDPNHNDGPHQTPAQASKGQSDGFFGLSKKTQQSPNTPTTPGPAVQENKDTFDFQKRMAYNAGPHIKLEHGNFETYNMPESLFSGLKDIFEAIVGHQARTGVVTPAKFMDTLRRNHEIFRSPMHQDAHEFLNLLLNEVVDEVEGYTKKNGSLNGQITSKPSMKGAIPNGLVSSNTSSWVHEIFEGTLTSETRCLTCENISQRDEVFLDLSVDLEEHSSVTSCLRKFSAEEMLCERNKFHCDKCSGLQEAEKRMKIKRLPQLLCLHLKRFKYTDDGKLNKLFHRVVYPFHLRLFSTTDDAQDPDRLYELYAVIVHLGGTPFHGHYVSIVKTKDRGWLLFDDELVLPVDKEYVRNFFGGDPKNPACAYVLFYQATTVEEVEKEQEAEESATSMAESFHHNVGLKLDTNVPWSPTMASPPDILPTPTVEETEIFNNRLDHAVTAPSRTPPLHTAPQSQYDYAHPSNYESHLTGASSGSSGDNAADDRAGVNKQDPSRPNMLHKTSSFNRFRNTSMSLRQKPKFWGGSKDRADEADGGVGGSVGLNKELERVQTEAGAAEKGEKSKAGRFGLGRKRSSMLPPARE